MSRGRVVLVIRRIVMPSVELNSGGRGGVQLLVRADSSRSIGKYVSMRISPSRGHLQTLERVLGTCLSLLIS
jgi:hypothetical protein